ncbi:MAG: 23S rRNA (guanosine(2251)-2'-O)-methyltransferase RlmB [Deltaproteobacteria bacterium]|nr:23S rRNA (guanosine(2251)-2'-O)-methyltransferase RlmB [Candidatus Anaeroferrophillacea bacterium]
MPHDFGAETDGGDIVSGVNAVAELLQAGGRSVAVLYVQESPSARIGPLVVRAEHLRVPVKIVPHAALSRLAATDRHQGVAARVMPVAFEPLEKILTPVPVVLSSGFNVAGPPLLLAVDEVTDPRNLGALLRCAAAAGVSGVLLPERRTVGITPVVTRTAAGGIEYLRFCRVKNLVRALEGCRERGFWTAGTVAEGGTPLYDVDLDLPLVVVMGSEDRGIRPLVRKNCDLLLTIPFQRPLESLNVAAAAAVVLFEIRRQQRAAAAARG